MTVDELTDLAAARRGEGEAFERLVAPHRRALHAHCYRMLGSVHDADDALQDALLGAWRGLAGFEGRSSLRSWLYRIATNAALRVAARRGPRLAAPRHATRNPDVHDLGEPVAERVFVEPCPDTDLRAAAEDEPEARYERLESIELAFVAALQELPATQRAVLLLRDVLAVPAAEVAGTLDTSVASVNSALQRARQTMARRLEPESQQARLRRLGDQRQRELVGALVDAWEARDVDGFVGLLTEDVRFTMPPLPAWFDGRDAVRRFVADRLFEAPWRVVPITANGQPAVAAYLGDGGRFPLAAVNVLSVRDGRIAALDGFLAPEAHEPFGLPSEIDR